MNNATTTTETDMTDLTASQTSALETLYNAYRAAKVQARTLEAIAHLSIVTPTNTKAYEALVRYGYAMQSAGHYWITVLGQYDYQESA